MSTRVCSSPEGVELLAALAARWGLDDGRWAGDYGLSFVVSSGNSAYVWAFHGVEAVLLLRPWYTSADQSILGAGCSCKEGMYLGLQAYSLPEGEWRRCCTPKHAGGDETKRRRLCDGRVSRGNNLEINTIPTRRSVIGWHVSQLGLGDALSPLYRSMTEPSGSLRDFYLAYIAALNARSSVASFVASPVTRNGQHHTPEDYDRMITDSLALTPVQFNLQYLLVDEDQHGSSLSGKVAARFIFECIPTGPFMGRPHDGKNVRFYEAAFYEVRDGKIQKVESLIGNLEVP